MRRAERPPQVVVVTGLPRSGTSMMMQMLGAGGLPVLTDGVRAADPLNPHGYYEYEPVKQLPQGEDRWLSAADGKVVKVISALLKYLPSWCHYHIIFMQRHIHEVLASQQTMLAQREPAAQARAVDNAEMATLFEKHLLAVDHWLTHQPHITLLRVHYNTLLANPRQTVGEIADFLPFPLETTRMFAAIDPSLYRTHG